MQTNKSGLLIKAACFLPVLCLFAAIFTYPASATGLLNKVKTGGLGEIGNKAYGANDGESNDPRVVTAAVIKVFLSLMGIVFLVLIVSAGYKWMTADGSSDDAQEALNKIKTATIGIIIIVAAYAITNFITAQAYKAVSPS